MLLVVIPPGLFAQMAGTGQVVGTVTDASGAAVVGATVTLTDMATNTSRTATTNEAGRYAFSNVGPGLYNLKISKTGFRIAKFSDQEKNLGGTKKLHLKLEIGSRIETAEET